jgi:hypothetical protein
MNKKKASRKKKKVKPGDAKEKLGVGVTGNPKPHKPKRRKGN